MCWGSRNITPTQKNICINRDINYIISNVNIPRWIIPTKPKARPQAIEWKYHTNCWAAKKG